MDLMMPEMDGLSAIRAIRAVPALRQLPIIALTAKARREDREQCLAAGANDYMAKPIDVDKLVSLCRVWMSR
jgi:CheY-like chemotaxis protein